MTTVFPLFTEILNYIWTVSTGSPVMETRDTFLPTTTVQAVNDSTRPQLSTPETKEWKKISQGLQKQKPTA